MPILPSSITRAASASTNPPDSPPSPVPRPQLKFDDQNDNFHRVEFDAPSSSSPQPLSKGRFSIDLSIELERELARMESPPDTPNNIGLRTGDVDREVNATSQGDDNHPQTHENEESLLPDPEILSHIVTQLRLSLASLTQERDTLVLLLARKTDEEASVKDALEAMVERATKAEEELVAARRNVKEGEEQIGLLRGKVEESRRGLMRLQTENRRQSTMLAPIDVNRASALTFANTPLTSASAKRASFTPLTGSRHGRIPSVSDIHSLGVDANGVLLPSPIATGFSNGDASVSQNLPHSGNGTRRVSGLFGRHSPSEHDGSVSGDHPISSEVQQELESLKAEVKSLKYELESAKRDVVEANEAREASEMCVQALRGFIKENGVGIRAETVEQGGVKPLPSVPLMAAEGEDGMRTTSGTSSGWGFTKLWASSLGPGTTTNSTSTESPTITKPSSSPSLPSATAPMAASASAGPLLSRKLTGLFGSRSARSSGSSIQSAVPISSAPSPPSMLERRDSASMITTGGTGASNGSDVSSVIEPVSPALSGSGLVLGMGMGFGARFGPGKVHEIPMEINGHGDGIEKGIETPILSLHEIELDGDGLK